MVGPKRCGKGTVARVVKNLVGPDNVVAPNLSNLPAQFGRQSLIGKQLALVPDFRLSGGVSNAQITEHLLQISGEDEVTIPRKHMDDWTGTLGVRFLLQSNELPKLADASGALVSRFILLQIKESFYGREDRGLTKKLLTELPGILNWAIEGWARLQKRGHFIMPKASEQTLVRFEELSQPIASFIRDKCVLEARADIVKDYLYREWKAWCKTQGRDYAGTAATFGEQLAAAEPKIGTSRRTVTERSGKKQRAWCYWGIRLKTDEELEAERKAEEQAEGKRTLDGGGKAQVAAQGTLDEDGDGEIPF